MLNVNTEASVFDKIEPTQLNDIIKLHIAEYIKNANVNDDQDESNLVHQYMKKNLNNKPTYDELHQVKEFWNQNFNSNH